MFVTLLYCKVCGVYYGDLLEPCIEASLGIKSIDLDFLTSLAVLGYLNFWLAAGCEHLMMGFTLSMIFWSHLKGHEELR